MRIDASVGMVIVELIWRLSMMLSAVYLLGRHLPNIKGKYALVFKGLGSLVPRWPSDVTVRSKQGISFVHCDLNDYIFKELYTFGVHELDVDWIFDRLLQPGDVIFDAGASFGYHALLCARRVGLEGHVFGVEPQPDMFALLEQNIRLNQVTNVTVRCIGLSDRTSKLALHRFAGLGTGHTSVATLGRDDYETIECEAVTLDSFVEAEGIQRIAMLKLDVEGSELPILKGADRLLRGAEPPMCVIEINSETSQSCGYSPKDLLAFLATYGYSFYRCARGRVIRNISHLERCDSVDHGDNILCAIWAAHAARLRMAGVRAPHPA